jgi:hypothetical protein
MDFIAEAAGHAISTSPSWTNKVSAIAEGATAAIALLALLGTVRQLRQTRAHQYLQRYDEPQLLPYIDKAHEVLTRGDADKSTRIDRWEDMSFRDQLDVLLFMNFWEEMAGMYNRKLVDRKIIDEYFGDPAIYYWKTSKWLALLMREQMPDAKIYNEWERMCSEMEPRLKPTQAPARPRASSSDKPRRRS